MHFVIYSGNRNAFRLKKEYIMYLFISVYLSSLPVAHLSDAPSCYGGHSARIQDETVERYGSFFNVLGV